MLDIGSKRPSVLVPLLNSQQNICIRYASGYAYGVACCMYQKGMHQVCIWCCMLLVLERYASGYAYGVACIKRVCIRVCIWCCMYRKGMHQGTPVSSHQGICILLCWRLIKAFLLIVFFPPPTSGYTAVLKANSFPFTSNIRVYAYCCAGGLSGRAC